MKKVIALILMVTLCMSMLVACKSNQSENIEQVGSEKNVNSEQNTESENTKSESTESEAVDTTDTNTATETATDDIKSTETTENKEKIDINIASLKGPTSMGLVKVMDDTKNGTAANNYKFTIAGAADEITAGIIKGDFDIAAIPCNLAAVLYNKSKGGLKVAGINTLGVLYILETGNEINTVEDLKGKTIYSTGKGTTPEYTLNYLLSSYGLDPAKDVTIEYKSEATEVAALLSEATDAVAMLPQPFVTTVMMKNDKLRVALDVAKEWDKVSKNSSSVVTGVVVVNKEFLENNKEAVDVFLSEYVAASKYVNENVEEAAALVEQFDIVAAAVAKQAIPNCNITLIQGDEMQTKVNGYLETLFNQNPETVGGTMPDEAFYYTN
jgi:NitT/TauT family transport system substrate-binding protein